MSESTKVSVSDWDLQEVVSKITQQFGGEPKVREARTVEYSAQVGLPRSPEQLILIELTNGQRFLVTASQVYG